MVHATAMLHCTHLDKCGGGDDRDHQNNCDDYDAHNCDDDDENISYASGSYYYQQLSIVFLNDWIDL